MPEGDTVYATARKLTEAMAGVPLVVGELRHPRLSTVDLSGRTLLKAVSVGKHLFLRFDGELSFHCHLGMDGSWRFYAGRPRIGHRVRAVLATPQRFALGTSLVEMVLVSTGDEHKLVDHLGPDLLDPDWSPAKEAEAVRRLTAKPERELGQTLLDQMVMAGVGNVYKSELCFLLGVSPWSSVSDVDAEKAVRLARKLLLFNALRPIRNTTGSRRRDLWVYGQNRHGCARCGGPVLVGHQDDRITYYCPRCQPGPTTS
ncbi:DNA-formamidopyrimidine glycosylase family protein [Actinophytocola oryzae]|uniref:DNA-(apurinic or apyrimidinic site) lyase n=1 Tax=Actinophytocola oryzae TaxID=502181 RepID=A0A4V3FTN7_9PSEU|nr:DNA-formamidopyrimidine glycosylase family protein [Actinophytocola oryzae]TDV52091.1 endonuclease-8 [Actinophytocola oryzae]